MSFKIVAYNEGDHFNTATFDCNVNVRLQPSQIHSVFFPQISAICECGLLGPGAFRGVVLCGCLFFPWVYESNYATLNKENLRTLSILNICSLRLTFNAVHASESTSHLRL